MRTKNYIPLESAKSIIITALGQFDTELGVRAAEILFNDKRLNIVEVTEAKTHMMMCRPSGITLEDIMATDMYIPDFAQKFGPHFLQQDNLADYAIIDFEYNGSPASVVWLGHELGHAIADDIQREKKNGRCFRDFSSGEMEEQAYFVQHIVSRHFRSHYPEFQNEDTGEDPSKMSKDRASQFNNAARSFEGALAKEPDQRKETVLNALGQRAPF